jgi:nucleoside 2-deoxyribosyltransferase
MMKTDFYLAHPLNTRHKVRDELQVPLQDLSYSVHNPFYGKDLQPRQDVAIIDAGRVKLYDISSERAQEIVKGDLDAIDNAEALLAYIPHPGIGTPMELFYASHVLGKKTFIVTTENYLRHPWIQTYGTVIRDNVEDIIWAIILEEKF